MKKLIFENFTKVLKGGGVLFIGMSVVNVGNYLFNLVLGRKLGPVDYGIFVSLNSVLAFTSVIGSTFLTTAMKFTSEFKASNQLGKTGTLIKYLNNKSIFIGIFITLIVMLLSKPIADFLNIGANTPVLILALYFLIIFSLSVNRGVLQGLQNFITLSINMAIEPILKIIFALIFIVIGFRINGAFGAVVIATLIVYLISFIPLKKLLLKNDEKIDLKMIWQYSGSTLIAFVFLSVLSFLDVVLVKHYFNPHDAGIYSALTTTSKIILYVSIPIISAMFPMISELHSKNKRHFPILAQTFIIVSVISLLGLSFFVIFPTFTINLLFGNQYLSAANYLGGLSLAFLLLTLSYVLIHYYLSIKKTGFIWLLFIAASVETLLIILYHNSFNQIINDLIISFGLLLFGLVMIYISSKKEQIIYAISNNSRL